MLTKLKNNVTYGVNKKLLRYKLTDEGSFT